MLSNERCERMNLLIDLPPHSCLRKNLYNDYHGFLVRPNDIKSRLNQVVKSTFSVSKEAVIESISMEYLWGVKTPSDEYISSLKGAIRKNVSTIIRQGGIPAVYKTMGVSPRILPVGYGESINNCKRCTKDYAYKVMGEEAGKLGYVIADLDLTSCYTSILNGLWPNEMALVLDAMSSSGLGNYIQSEFERAGKGNQYHKPSVKVCVYSFLFGGGHKAIIDGIINDFCKDLGFTKEKFPKKESYKQCYEIAHNVTKFMRDSDIVGTFLSCTKH